MRSEGKQGRSARRGRVIAVVAALTATLIPSDGTAEPLPWPGGDQCVRGFRAPEDAAEQLMRGIVEIPPFPPYELGMDPDWSVDPFQNASWVASLHSLLFTEPLRLAYAETGDQTYLTRWHELLSDWIDDNPADLEDAAWQAWGHRPTALRAQLFACAVDWLPATPAWRGALVEHGTVLESEPFYARIGNHALEQNLGLLAVGCKLGHASWIERATGRTVRLVDESIDPQGGINEGSIAYALTNHDWYGEALTRMRRCGRASEPAIVRARARLTRFIVHGTLPDGRFVRIGDSFDHARLPIGLSPAGDHLLTRGRRGDAMGARFAWYRRAGWVFDRSSWTDPRARHVALRTGRVALHNHEDQGSFVVSAFGRRLLDDAGVFGYFTPLNEYFRGPTGHNAIVVDDAEVRRLPATVRRLRVSEGWAMHLRLPVWRGVRWTRTVLVLEHGAVIVVADHATSQRRRTFRQTWHLAEGSSPSLVAHGARTGFRRGNLAIAVGGDPARMRLVSGQRSPRMQGWIGFDVGTMRPAPVLEAIRSGTREARFVTVLAAGPNAAPRVHLYLARARVGGFEAAFTIDRRRYLVEGSDRAVSVASSRP